MCRGEEPGSCIPPLNNDLFILLAHTEKTDWGNVNPQIALGLSGFPWQSGNHRAPSHPAPPGLRKEVEYTNGRPLVA